MVLAQQVRGFYGSCGAHFLAELATGCRIKPRRNRCGKIKKGKIVPISAGLPSKSIIRLLIFPITYYTYMILDKRVLMMYNKHIKNKGGHFP